MRFLAGLACVLALSACGSGRDSTFDPGGGGGPSGASGDGGSGGGFTAGNGGGNGDCADAVKNYVYVLSAERGLYRFAPDKKVFSKVGDLRCTDDPSSIPNSMAIDRAGNAWVNYVTRNPDGSVRSGSIYKASIADASCDASTMFALPDAWARIGMGFSTDAADSTKETLYVASTAGSTHELGRLDIASQSITPLGPFVPANPFGSLSAELTGTGDARLYGMFIQIAQVANRPSPVVGQIDKSSASTESPMDMSGVEAPNAWAFSFWGGHFYLYTSPWYVSTRTSNVTDYDPMSGNINSEYMTNVGFNIVGAGVSTCAPVTQPPIH